MKRTIVASVILLSLTGTPEAKASVPEKTEIKDAWEIYTDMALEGKMTIGQEPKWAFGPPYSKPFFFG